MVFLISALLALLAAPCERVTSQPGTFGAPHVASVAPAPQAVAYAAPEARITTETVAAYRVTLTQGAPVAGAYVVAEAEAPFALYLCPAGAAPPLYRAYLPHVQHLPTDAP